MVDRYTLVIQPRTTEARVLPSSEVGLPLVARKCFRTRHVARGLQVLLPVEGASPFIFRVI